MDYLCYVLGYVLLEIYYIECHSSHHVAASHLLPLNILDITATLTYNYG